MFEEIKILLSETITSDYPYNNDRKRKRKIIFWYDAKGEYKDLVDDIVFPEDTKLIKYENNSFWVRYYIEMVEPNKNIVLYIPYERETGIKNDLLDLEMANKDMIFIPDSTTMRLKNLKLSNDFRSIIEKNHNFFKDKKREERFKLFEMDKDLSNVDYIITSILLNIKSINTDDILKNIIKVYYSDKECYEDLFKFGNKEFILNLFNSYFGSNINDVEEIEDLFKSLLFTYFASNIKEKDEINRYGKYLLKKVPNVSVFVNNLMRDIEMQKYFEIISDIVFKEFGILEVINRMNINDYLENDAFKYIDDSILKYVVNILSTNILDNTLYDKYIKIRFNKYWFNIFENEYHFLINMINFNNTLEQVRNMIKIVDIDLFIKNYVNEIYKVDYYYRKAYYHFDNINNKDIYLPLKELLENKYINDFMMDFSIKWSNIIEHLPSYENDTLVIQNNFYDHYLRSNFDKKERNIVIISDAFRYECAVQLFNELVTIGSKVSIDHMLGVVPTYTKLGMAALLPNKKLSIVDNSDEILVDDLISSSLKDREKILQLGHPNSLAIKYDDLYNMTKTEWKRLFTGQKIVYIYHDRIDNTGEHNENDVFKACFEAVKELGLLIRDLHITFSGISAFITADHGFFYKRGKVESYEKTTKDKEALRQKTRYSYSKSKLKEEGILSINLDYLFGKDSGYVNIPKGHTIFERQGSGFNYIHGGILPQEVIIPVIDFKSSRNTEESKKVTITYSGLTTRITNAITYLNFIQDSDVDENNIRARYLLHFEDDKGVVISNECTIIANYENTDVKDRFFKEKFVFKNMDYSKERDYYLVIIDEETGIEVSRKQFYIDIAIIDNFGF
ncbi:MAG: BREX-1 system phosphatase PglZ type A [Bacilli bacterium]|jgi:uncharacterized protein (TIGR02687 family)